MKKTLSAMCQLAYRSLQICDSSMLCSTERFSVWSSDSEEEKKRKWLTVIL